MDFNTHHLNIISKTELERLLGSGIPYNVAFIMACVKGNQPHLAIQFVEQERQDQEILMMETYKNLCPIEEINMLKEYPPRPPSPLPLSIEEEYTTFPETQ